MVPTRTSVSRLASVLAALVFAGCQIGPRMLPVSNAHYSDAVRVSQSEQFLANLVRLRYRDLPVFLAVTNISTQFELSSSAAIGVTAGEVPTDYTAGTGVSFSERPTISFSILGGEAFQKRLLRPIDLDAISLLAESGWRIDRVLRLTVERLNGLSNASTASGPTPSEAPQYAEFLEATSELESLRGAALVHTDYRTERTAAGAAIPVSQVDGASMVDAAKQGLEFESVPERRDTVQLTGSQRRLVLRLGPESDQDPRVQRLRNLLRLKSDARIFDVVALEDSGFDPLNPRATMARIGTDTRSLMGVLYYLSNGVEAPAEHVAAGLVTQTATATGPPFDWKSLLGDVVSIHSSRHCPRNAAIAVKYRGYWFYVADDDQTTKATFMLLSELFALQAGEISPVHPVLTLPVGG